MISLLSQVHPSVKRYSLLVAFAVMALLFTGCEGGGPY